MRRDTLTIDRLIASLLRWSSPTVHPSHVEAGTADLRARTIGRELYRLAYPDGRAVRRRMRHRRVS